MFRKWMSVILSLLLAAALPLTALADTQHTLSVVPGDMLASEEAVADLLDALALRITEGEKSGALSVMLNDQVIVTAGLTADATGLYAASGLLGEDVLYVTWDDGFAMLNDLLAGSMAQAGADEDVQKGLEATLAEVKNAIVSAIAAGNLPAAQSAVPVAMEESLKLVQEMFPDDPAMVDYIKGLYDEMTIEDGSFADEDRDTADQKYRMVMDESDLVAICDTNYMKSIITEAMAVEMADASEAEIAEAAEKMLDEVRKIYEESGLEMIMEMYTLDAGQTLVGMEMIMNMSVDATESGEEGNTGMQMAAEYDRLTDENGVSHQASAAMAADLSMVEVSFDLYRANSGKSAGMLGMLADGEEVVVLYEAEQKAADTRERSFDLYFRSNATSILTPAASARPVIGIKLVTEPAPAETLAALENANAENSVDVLKLSEAEWKALGEQISLNATQILYTALSQLPTSALSLLMSSGMMQ